MVAENWIHKMRNNRTKNKKRAQDDPTSSPDAAAATIGILSFEVASTMSRAVHLHRSLSDQEISRLRSHTLSSSTTITTILVPHDLLALALAEKLDDLNRIAAATARLGRRCSLPALLAFDHVYSDLLAARIPDPAALGFLSTDISAAVRRMDRLASSTAALYAELESLSDLEHSAKKYSLPPSASASASTAAATAALDQKIQWQRHDVKILRDASLWNYSFDKAVLLLARAVCTIHARIRYVFAEAAAGLDSLIPEHSRQQLSGPIAAPRRHIPLNSGPIRSDSSELSGPMRKEIEPPPRNFQHRFPCGGNPSRLFMVCLSLTSSLSYHDKRFQDDSCLSLTAVPFSGNTIGALRFGPKSTLLSLASPSTVGGSCLALHYANVIIIIEKLLRYPHLVGDEARDDLYQMLPASLRGALRKSLRSYAKNLAIYDASLAHDWKEAMESILSWLAPMAHNMIRWQTDRNFEQQQIVSRANVLLLETLYFADREKTEAAMCELLVGLNYICRYEQQQNALIDCSSSVDFDDSMDWQLQY